MKTYNLFIECKEDKVYSIFLVCLKKKMWIFAYNCGLSWISHHTQSINIKNINKGNKDSILISFKVVTLNLTSSYG